MAYCRICCRYAKSKCIANANPRFPSGHLPLRFYLFNASHSYSLCSIYSTSLLGGYFVETTRAAFSRPARRCTPSGQRVMKPHMQTAEHDVPDSFCLMNGSIGKQLSPRGLNTFNVNLDLGTMKIVSYRGHHSVSAIQFPPSFFRRGVLFVRMYVLLYLYIRVVHSDGKTKLTFTNVTRLIATVRLRFSIL